jgi:hypothetical protein
MLDLELPSVQCSAKNVQYRTYAAHLVYSASANVLFSSPVLHVANKLCGQPQSVGGPSAAAQTRRARPPSHCCEEGHLQASSDNPLSQESGHRTAQR